MKLRILFFNFTCDGFIRDRSSKVRGYFANKFGEYTLIHHHLERNKFLYKYPLIQYKVLRGKPLIVGINEGADTLQEINEDINELRLNGTSYSIREKNIVFRTEESGIIEIMCNYKFLTPWLALNQKNYQELWALNKQEKQEKLKRTLIGNILSMAKGLEYVVTEEIKAEVDVKPVKTSLKGVPMMGFTGEFQVNFEIPDYLGIGKSVSSGFGTVVRKLKEVEIKLKAEKSVDEGIKQETER